MVNDSCQCVNGYIGTTCERLMEDCTEGYEYYPGQMGTFLIQPPLAPEPIPTVCRMEYDLRTYLQLRHYTSGIPFDRDWTSYRDCFGDIYEENDGTRDFWWGNQNAYYLTNSRQYDLLIQAVGYGYSDIGNIVYKNFVVQDEL
ncbi:fibrinogen gamma chain-like [Pecten maximus]|uniref:fibrinogen gamma chain-like n=1 Tax=Pecten maximus TaxID=6579 RepID=UPI001458A67A|nr:fibrinogen gamma chain-like [Pecten maximus]